MTSSTTCVFKAPEGGDYVENIGFDHIFVHAKYGAFWFIAPATHPHIILYTLSIICFFFFYYSILHSNSLKSAYEVQRASKPAPRKADSSHITAHSFLLLWLSCARKGHTVMECTSSLWNSRVQFVMHSKLWCSSYYCMCIWFLHRGCVFPLLMELITFGYGGQGQAAGQAEIRAAYAATHASG